jgi:hypothetical protein
MFEFLFEPMKQKVLVYITTEKKSCKLEDSLVLKMTQTELKVKKFTEKEYL